MLIILLVFVSLYLSIQIIHLLRINFWSFDKPEQSINIQNLPEISVLVAARNEEKNIGKCIESLLALSYPKHLLHIYIGDDNSTDNTASIVKKYCDNNTQVNYISIQKTLGVSKGKANVLAHLCKVAKGDYFFITDADIIVQPLWAKTILSYFKNNVAIVSGTTVVKGDGFLSSMQQIDWLYFMDLLLTFDKLGLKSTAVGNNMAITRSAYEKTGGYENFPFSITEDFMLFYQVRKLGFSTINMIHPNAINFSAAVDNWKILLQQRKRWLKGATGLPFYWWVIFLVYVSFYPALLALSFYSFSFVFFLLAVKWLLQSIGVILRLKQLQIPVSISSIVLYEFYSVCITLGTAFYFILPQKVNWKGRYY
ncbi:MAG: glycosyltransferase [Bacteroidia bacterium]|nr:glycosyltransferase [Bacteroidia bacterium]